MTTLTSVAAVPAETTVATQPLTGTWKIDPSHTSVEFAIRHMMISTVKGRFGEVAGTIVVNADQPALASVDVAISVASIDTREAQRDQHLRSADFFDAEHFPQLTFKGRRVEPADVDDGSYRVIGDLTIRDVTREVVLDANYQGAGKDPFGNQRIAFGATTKINRKDYGLHWNVGLEAGGVLVGDEVKISIEVEAVSA